MLSHAGVPRADPVHPVHWCSVLSRISTSRADVPAVCGPHTSPMAPCVFCIFDENIIARVLLPVVLLSG